MLVMMVLLVVMMMIVCGGCHDDCDGDNCFAGGVGDGFSAGDDSGDSNDCFVGDHDCDDGIGGSVGYGWLWLV